MRSLLASVLFCCVLAPGARAAADGPAVVLLGPPGVGKSTQAQRLAAAHGWAVVATGELLRDEVARKTALGARIAAQISRGELVADELVDELVRHRLQRADCRGGVILDGYPRTVAQARALDALLHARGAPPPIVLHLEAPDDVLLARLGTRGRADDERDVIAHRLSIYRAEIAPIVAFYRAARYHLVRGDQSVDEVLAALERAIATDAR